VLSETIVCQYWLSAYQPRALVKPIITATVADYVTIVRFIHLSQQEERKSIQIGVR